MSVRKSTALAAFAFCAAVLPIASHAKEIIVQIGPPAPRIEVVPAARAGYDWVPGYWGWQHSHHVWIAGHWVRERHGYHYVPHRWEERDGRWHLHDGYWQH